MGIQWKLAGLMVSINVTLALVALVGLGQNDPNWIETSPQLAETGTQATFELASVIGTIVR